MTKKKDTKQQIDKDTFYDVREAIDLIKEHCKCKFDATIEAHFNLGIDEKKQDQLVRTSTTLPHGTGKTIKVAVFASEKIENADLELSEADLSKIESGEIKPKIDFDIIVSEPKSMPKLAKVAKTLGPIGMMPNPKNGTVTDDIAKAVDQIKKGKINIKNEQNAPIVHTVIGKKSFETKKLVENFEEVLSALRQAKPQKVKVDNYIKNCFISSTMSPSVKIKIS